MRWSRFAARCDARFFVSWNVCVCECVCVCACVRAYQLGVRSLESCTQVQREEATKRHNGEMAEMMMAMKRVQKTVADYHARVFRALVDTSNTSPSPL